MADEEEPVEIALGFANTWEDRSDPSTDKLREYLDVLQWAVDSGSIEASEHRQLVENANDHPRFAKDLLDQALELRESVFRLCAAAAGNNPPPRENIEVLNRWLEQLPGARLEVGDECCCWQRPSLVPDLRKPLVSVVLSAADLLTSANARRIRQCAASDCSWLFIDASRGRRRRWCDMSTCGNRAKARRYYQRHHGNT